MTTVITTGVYCYLMLLCSSWAEVSCMRISNLQSRSHSIHLLAQLLQGLTELTALLVCKGGYLSVNFIAVHLLHEPAT